MIVSHSHKFIYFAVPKTATHAVREALRVHLAPGDWEQQVLKGEQYLPVPELASIGHGHISATAAKRYLDASIWSQYRRIAFVRNPFDRFVSACAFLTRGAPEFSREPQAWMKRALQLPKFRQRVLIRPQHIQLCDQAGELAMHDIGRYETLQDSMNMILSSLELPITQLLRRNASKHQAWQLYYDNELQDMVSEYYARDLELFNYPFSVR